MSPHRELVVVRPGTLKPGDIVRVPVAQDAHDGGDAIIVEKRWEIIDRDSTHDVVTGHDRRTGFTAVDPTTDRIALRTGQDFIVERVPDLARAPTLMERLEREVHEIVRDAQRERDEITERLGHVSDRDAVRINANLGEAVQTLVHELYEG